jgi:hypothetical protein
MISARKRLSLYQEFHGVIHSSRRTILSSKSKMRRVIGRAAGDPIEQHHEALLSRSPVPSEKLELLVVQVCEAADVSFEGARVLNRSTKKEVLEWIGENLDTLSEPFTTIAVNQRIVNTRSRG